jgi:catechol 2,3-dioxygenase-like lactoylglutathione lyase family enzyme
MLSYVMVGTNDMARARAFYDPLLEMMGVKPNGFSSEKWAWYAPDGAVATPMFVVTRPANGDPATVGNGVMVTLSAASRAVVDSAHAKAMALGAQDEGQPGVRADVFYMAYFRDPDGNKIALCHVL